MTGRRAGRSGSAALFVGVLLVYLASGDYRWINPDPGSALLSAWQLANHGNLYLDQFAGQKLWLLQVGEHTVSGRFPGTTLLALPFYLLSPSPTPTAVPSVVAAAVATAAAVVVLHRLLLGLVAPRVALGASLVAAFATATWPVSGNGLWTHGPGQLLVLVGVLLVARGRFGAAGLAYGGAVLVRPQLALVAAVTGLLVAWQLRSWRPALKVAVGGLLGVLLLLAYNRVLFQQWTLVGGYTAVDPSMGRGTGLWQFLVNVAGTLVSPSRGLVWLCPYLLLLLPGLPAAWRTAPGWVRGAALGGAVYTLLQLWMIHWSGGYAFFGNRLVLEGLTVAAPLLVLAHQSWTTRTALRRRLFTALVAVSVTVHGLGAFLHEAREVDVRVLIRLQWWDLVQTRPTTGTALALGLLLAAAVGARTLRDPGGTTGSAHQHVRASVG